MPPSATYTPKNLFRDVLVDDCYQFVRCDDREEFLIYIDGSCLNNGQANAKAGWAFVFGPESYDSEGVVSARLERNGPFGQMAVQTSNRAELRAVLGALRFRAWENEGFNTMVIATDSEYVAEGATYWLRIWVGNGWKTTENTDVKNKDLWEVILGQIELLHDRGLRVQFWRIPRQLNQVADCAARYAAEDQDRDRYRDILWIA
ncbi:hypothetical protein CDD80_2523 [Ophiocordyceps camponoti-rufipedis]|uniref:ribonuclease H n=1 Tax=Ophiocordyceps camponoti-rufipedis TaxID=2004952 RepID=A0A2C5Z786_9HYPO|nr:hypothetical protein CDD80_2523 [Ophiocordyceps camponoti-rufipedis]